jgi:ribose/xylose/arabinose/galactoside ABC-type transport system permease subunit
MSRSDAKTTAASVDFSLPRFVRGNSALVFAVLLVLLASAVSPSFRSPGNIKNVLILTAPLGATTLGQAFVILVGGLDLSVASVMATAAIVATSFGDADSATPTIVAVSLAIATIVGLVNGWLVTQRNVSPFLATFATNIVLQGMRFAWTKGAPLGGVPPVFRFVGTGVIFGVPINAILVVIGAALLSVALSRTRFGRSIYIVGGNQRAARLIGLNTTFIIMSCYVISSMLAALGGLALVGYVGSIDNWVGRGYELDSIVACVIGGLALTGGRGSLIGALFGALILNVIFDIVLLLGMPVQVQLLLKGFVIVAAAAYGATRPARS